MVDNIRIPLVGGGEATLATSESGGIHTLKVSGIADVVDFKPSVKAASTANLTLSGAQTVDGIALIAGDRILVKDQTATEENGIYLVAAGAWTRATDANTWDELVRAVLFF